MSHKVPLSPPTLFLMVGLPGAGKTTKSQEIEATEKAFRFNADEWLLILYGKYFDKSKRDAVKKLIEEIQWNLAKRALALGQNVVIDWGLWSIEERKMYRAHAQALGAKVKMIFLDAPLDVLWERIAKRPESQEGILQITREDLEEWSKRFQRPSQEELSSAESQ